MFGIYLVVENIKLILKSRGRCQEGFFHFKSFKLGIFAIDYFPFHH